MNAKKPQYMFAFSIAVIAFALAYAAIKNDTEGFFAAVLGISVLVGILSGLVALFDTKSTGWKSNIRKAVIFVGPLALVSLIIHTFSTTTVGLNSEESFNLWMVLLIIVFFAAASSYQHISRSKKELSACRDEIVVLTKENNKLSERVDGLLAANEVLRLTPIVKRLQRRLSVAFPHYDITFTAMAYRGKVERNTLYMHIRITKGADFTSTDEIYDAASGILSKLNPSIRIEIDE